MKVKRCKYKKKQRNGSTSLGRKKVFKYPEYWAMQEGAAVTIAGLIAHGDLLQTTFFISINYCN